MVLLSTPLLSIEGLTFMLGWVPESEEKCFVERKR